MWYVIQTIAGNEEKLASRINIMLSKSLYTECFVIRSERPKRLGEEWRIQALPLFPGYVFIETGKPEDIFLELRGIPKAVRLLGSGRSVFTAVEDGEQRFLEMICEAGTQGREENEKQARQKRENQKNQKQGDQKREDGPADKRRVVRLSEVKTDQEGKIEMLRGPLGLFEKQIERINFHKRYAVARVRLCGREQTVLFGLKPWREEDGCGSRGRLGNV